MQEDEMNHARTEDDELSNVYSKLNNIADYWSGNIEYIIPRDDTTAPARPAFPWCF